ncbi:MAG TPA: lipopolysaccharide biosynthesis protein [Magnetospirillum sp.]|jgi:O-antigen/teichoic acid export membrane protein|nr:lipopolysaccharide biosynthesis protein [Magnetospirillum sp.]
MRQNMQPASSWGGVTTLVARIAGDRVRALSLIEQGLISGANFFALLLLARGFDADDFGTFSFAWLTLLFVVNIQRSAVVVPFVIHTAEPGVLQQEAPAWRRLSLWTTALSTVSLGLIAACLPLFKAPEWMETAFVMAAIFVTPTFAYEFRRRWLIQLDRFGTTVLAAATYATLYVAGIVVAVVTHRLELAAAAFLAANGGAALLCAILAPRLPPPDKPPEFGPFLRNLGHFIGWSVAANLAYNGYGHLPPLILGALAGPGPVALFQAMRNFTQPLSTAATAVDNFDKPRAARALAAHGVTGLRRALTHTTAAMAGMTLPYVVLLILLGDRLVNMLYGPRYGDPTLVLAWFAAVHVAVVFVYPLETALFLLRRPDLLFRGRVVSAVIGVALCFVLVPDWGLGGAMAGITGGIVGSGLAALFLLVREKPWTTL